MHELGVSLGAVRLAIRELTADDTLVRIARKGTFVSRSINNGNGSFGKRHWAVVVPQMEYFYPPLLQAIETHARAVGKAIMIHCSQDNVDLERRQILQAIEDGAEGILVAPATPQNPRRTAEDLEYLGELPVPAVVMDHWAVESPAVSVDCVVSDNFAGGYESTAHMIRHGYRNIVILSDKSPDIPGRAAPEFIQRVNGYHAAMDDHGLEPMDFPPISNWVLDNRPEEIRQRIDAGAKAFILLDDASAAILIRLLTRWSIAVSDEVAVIGYDDEPFCTMTDPSLSSVRVPKQQMARKAVQLLKERIDNGVKGNYRTVIFKPTVVARASCGKHCPDRARKPRPAKKTQQMV